MSAYDYVLCLFCLSGKEKEAVENIRKMECGVALFPQKIKHFRDKKEWADQPVPLVPGYVFVYMTEAEKESQYKLSGIPEVIRVLSYGDEDISWLQGNDLEFADLIWRKNGLLGEVQTAKIGDRVEVVDNDLMQFHGKVAQVDKRKRMVLIRTEGAGIIDNVWLPYHMVEACGKSVEK